MVGEGGRLNFGGKLGVIDCLGDSCGEIGGGGGATSLQVTVPSGHESPSIAIEMHARMVPETNMHGPEPEVQPSQSPVPS